MRQRNQLLSQRLSLKKANVTQIQDRWSVQPLANAKVNRVHGAHAYKTRRKPNDECQWRYPCVNAFRVKLWFCHSPEWKRCKICIPELREISILSQPTKMNKKPLLRWWKVKIIKDKFYSQQILWYFLTGYFEGYKKLNASAKYLWTTRSLCRSIAQVTNCNWVVTSR